MSRSRLADVRVRLSWPALLLAGAVFVRASGDFPLSTPYRVAWTVAGLLCLVSVRGGAAAVAALSAVIVHQHFSNHMWFFMWIAGTFAIFPNEQQRRFIVRWQLSILYGFTGISKLTPVWLSGVALQNHLVRGFDLKLPFSILVILSIGVALTELFLAAGLWLPRLRPVVLWVAGISHLSFWLGLGNVAANAPALVTFNGLAFGMLVWATAGMAALSPEDDDAGTLSMRDRDQVPD